MAVSLAETADFHQVGTGRLLAPFAAAVFAPVVKHPAAILVLALATTSKRDIFNCNWLNLYSWL